MQFKGAGRRGRNVGTKFYVMKRFNGGQEKHRCRILVRNSI